ncbi:MAG: hypothetical protein ABI895_17755 [Deltaproteobacteria bacterium]
MVNVSLGLGSSAMFGCNGLLGIEDAKLACADPACPREGDPTAARPAGLMMAASTNSAVAAAAPGANTPDVDSMLPLGAEQGPTDSTDRATPVARTAPPLTSPTGSSSTAVEATYEQPATEPNPDAPVSGPAVGPDGLAVALPNDLISAPVNGEIVYSDDAVWEVNGVFQSTFEIHTPTASYWIVKSLGTMVSLEDAAGTQWLAFSSGFRPLRGVPSFAAPPAAVTTVRDYDSQTPTHSRLTAASRDGLWQWIWDFYVTHATFTINRAPVPYGFAYRGVPGASLGMEDRLIPNASAAQSARNSFEADLPGPSEWLYIADTALGRSIFLIQHSDDGLADRYQVQDNDSAMWLFGNGAIQSLPMRFSLGLIDSADAVRVGERIQFVVSVTH